MRLAIIDKFEDYIQYMVEHKEELEIVISSTDNVGFKMSENAADLLLALGIKTDLHRVRGLRGNSHRGYIAIISGGEVVYEKLAQGHEQLEYKDDKYEIFSTVHSGVLGCEPGYVRIKGSDENYCANGRGVNFALFDKATGDFIDSAGFDLWAYENSSVKRLSFLDIFKGDKLNEKFQSEYKKLTKFLTDELMLGDDRKAIVADPPCVGDNWYLLSMVNYAMKLHNKTYIPLLRGERQMEMATFFEKEIYSYQISPLEKRILFSEMVNDKIKDTNIILVFKDIDSIAHIFINSYHLPEYIITTPKFPEFNKEEYIEKYNIIEGKTVYIVPESEWQEPLPIWYWNILADNLRMIGFHVVFNSDNKNYDGVLSKVPLRDAVKFAELCGYVIGSRTGFLDFLASAKANIIVIDPGPVCYHNSNFRIDYCFNIDNSDGHIRYVDITKLNYSEISAYKNVIDAENKSVLPWRDQSVFQFAAIKGQQQRYEALKIKRIAYFGLRGNLRIMRQPNNGESEKCPLAELFYAVNNGFVTFQIKYYDFIEGINTEMRWTDPRRRRFCLKNYSHPFASFPITLSGEYTFSLFIQNKATHLASELVAESISLTHLPGLEVLPYIEDFNTYISDISALKEKLLIIIVTNNTYCPMNASTDYLKILNEKLNLGVLSNVYQQSYAAVIDGNIIREYVSDNSEIKSEYKLGDRNLEICSRGGKCETSFASVTYNQYNLAVNEQGLNFVVFNKETNEVVDTVCFDTFDIKKTARRKEPPNSAYTEAYDQRNFPYRNIM